MTKLISSIFTLILIAFLIRWAINWILLNRLNRTNYWFFKPNASFQDFYPRLKHIAISEWKPWWTGSQEGTLKLASNIFSTIIYLGMVLLILIIASSKN